jgi:hypothetical protein
MPLTDASLPRAERLTAATSILRGDAIDLLSQFATLLRASAKPDPADPELASILLEAISSTAEPPTNLLPALIDYANTCAPERVPQALQAIAALASRDAARYLIDHLAPGFTPQVQEAAGAALIRMAGHSEWATDATRWNAWLTSISSLTDAAFKRELAQGLIDQRSAQQIDLARLRSLAGDGYRRLYLSTPIDARPALLRELFGSAEPALRDTALDIVTRELSDGIAPDSAVGTAIIKLLDSPDSTVRVRAASIAALLPPQQDRARLEAVLTREREPRVVAELLRALERTPSPSLRDAALKWIAQTPGPAGQALAACADAGLIDTLALKEAVLEALRQQPCSSLTAPALRLLAEWGTDRDRARIGALLESPPGSTRIAAASALAPRTDYLPRIIAAARTDPGLFLPAIDAALAGTPSIQTYRALETLPARTEADRVSGLERVAGMLAVPDLLNVASDHSRTLQSRETLLAPLARQGPEARTPRPPADLSSIAAALLLLAETRLALGFPETALVALDAAPAFTSPAEADRAARLRLLALLRTNQVPAALALQAPASAWLDSLQQCAAEPQAATILKLIRARYAHLLSGEEAKRLDDIASRVAPPDPTSAEAPDDDMPADPLHSEAPADPPKK